MKINEWVLQKFDDRVRLAEHANKKQVVADISVLLAGAFFSIVGYFFFAIGYFMDGLYPLGITTSFGLVMSIVALLLAIRLQAPVLAVHFLSLGSFVCLGVGSFWVGGIEAPGILWFPPVVLLNVFLLRGANVFVWPTLFIGLGFVFAAAGPLHLPIQQIMDPQQHHIYLVLASTGSLSLSSILALMFQKTQFRLNHLDRQHNLQIESASAENSRLIRMMSHDISNSLQVVKLAVRKMNTCPTTTSGPGDCAKNLARAERATLAIESLILHVREHQAILSGKKSLNLEAVDIHEALEELKTLFLIRYQDKGVVLEISSLCRPGASVIADRTPLVHVVLSNLLSNALKFTEGGKKVTLEVKPTESNVEFQIRDEGIGIPEDILQNIFEMTTQTSRPGTQGESGTGFGMPMVKAYLEKMNSPFRIESKTKVNSGTTFTFTLPAK